MSDDRPIYQVRRFRMCFISHEPTDVSQTIPSKDFADRISTSLGYQVLNAHRLNWFEKKSWVHAGLEPSLRLRRSNTHPGLTAS